MGNQTARERISAIIARVARHAVIDHQQYGYDYMDEQHARSRFLSSTDSIVEIIRETMLSDDAVTAGAKEFYSGDWDKLDDEQPHDGYAESFRQHLRVWSIASTEASLDIAFGEDDQS